MRKISVMIGSMICAAALAAVSSNVSAQPKMGGMRDHSMGSAMAGMGHSPGHGSMPHGKHRGGHLFGPHWRQDLTDDQKAEIDWMHLRLRQKQQVIEADISLKKAELNQLVTNENSDTDALRAKLDELLELKGEHLLNKYQHIIEMRQVLTPQQRVSFDLGILSDRHGGKHR